jgi:hypothetical protein
VEHERSGTHPYRDPLRIVKVARLHAFVRAASITNSALFSGIAWCFFMCAISLSCRDLRAAVTALGLGFIGLVIARNANRLSLRGPDELTAVRRPIVFGAIVSFLVYGAIALTFVAMARGKLDGLDFEPQWLEFTITASQLPQFIAMGEHHPILWQPSIAVTIVHTCFALLHACLWLGAVVLADRRITNSDTRFPALLRAGLLAIFAALVGVAIFLEGMPARIEHMAKGVYQSIERPCLLPPLPENATEVSADQRIDFMYEYEHVQFKVHDPTTYKRSLRENWYGSEIQSNSNTRETLEPPQWSEDVNHYIHGWSYGTDHTTTCEVFVDQNHGIIRIKMVEMN